MNRIALFLSTVLFLWLMALPIAAQVVSADLVIVNANIRTMDAKRTTARSIAVLNSRIIAIGSAADTKSLIGPNTRVIDAKGKLVLPGFNDAHVHFMETGAQLSSVDLRSAKTPEEFVRRIKDFTAKLPKGRWITGGNWDHENWTPNDLPTAAMIDAATPDNPVFVDRLDGHMALANSLAMKLAGMQTERIARALGEFGPNAHEAARRFLTAMIDADGRDGVQKLIARADRARRPKP